MFNLTRFFSILSLGLIVLAAAVLGPLYRELALREMQQLAESSNAALARVAANALDEPLRTLLRSTVGQRQKAAGTIPGQQALGQQLPELMRGTGVIRVSLFNRLGVVVFSTDERAVGERVDTPRFREAIGGRVGSSLLPEFAGTAQTTLLSSYIPVRGADGSVEAVFEFHQDVTPFMARLNDDLWLVYGALFSILAMLYLLQYFLVRHAQGILREQAGRIAAARDTLELQVEARTEELRRINQQLAAEVVERRQAESKLNYLACHDPLTGLSNRRALIDHLRGSLDEGGRLAVLFIDLDQFKQVNDSLGHAFGDEVLVAVAGRLSGHVRLIDRLARLGGDEFICLMEGVQADDDPALLAGEIIAAFNEAFVLGEHALYLSVSVGISRYPEDGGNVETLMRNADTAMYHAKARGRGQFCFYEPAMTESARVRIRLENQLRRAFDQQEFAVYLQPQVDAASGRLTGAEALLRWHSPALGEVEPKRFIPVAEETGLIFALGDWVLRETCRQVVRWRDSGFVLPQVAVNLSARQLARPGFVAALLGLIEETGIDPQCLKLELTESVLMEVDDACTVLHPLRALGVTLALDDFGTGYSSLSYLKRLPVQQLKIDASFVAGIGHSAGDEAIVRTIMELARSLSFEVVAEGVETAGQAAFLRGLGCQRLQGYLHGAAVAPDEFHARWRLAA